LGSVRERLHIYQEFWGKYEKEFVIFYIADQQCFNTFSLQPAACSQQHNPRLKTLKNYLP